MKKVKVFMKTFLIITSLLLLIAGCEKKSSLHMDAEKCAEVIVMDKSGDDENRYSVTVYPDGSSDENKDGYYDSYKVISDNYMSELISKYAKKEINRMLMEVG